MTLNLPKKINDFIVVNPKIRNGIPCVKGTQIPVSLVIRHISKGWRIDDLKEIFPTIKPSIIKQIIFYISEGLSNGKKEDETRSFNY